MKLFHNLFVGYNSLKCKVIYKNKICKLREFIEDNDNNYNYKGSIKIKLLELQNIHNLGYMFCECESLFSITEKEFQHDIKISKTFRYSSDSEYSESLISKKDDGTLNDNNTLIKYLSKSYNKKITKINHMFYRCTSLTSIPDLSKYDTSNVKNMNYIFAGCNSLKSLPDISQWNTSKVIYMNNMFNACISLISLPDLSGWNTSNVKYE